MSWKQFAASIVGSVAWPLAVAGLVLLIWYSAPAEDRRSLLRRIKKAGPTGVELNEAEREVSAASGSLRAETARSSEVAEQGASTQTRNRTLGQTQRLIDAAARWGWLRAGGAADEFPHPLVVWTQDGAKIIGSRVGVNSGDMIAFAPGSYIDPDTGKPNTSQHTIMWLGSDDLEPSGGQ